jgi:hypothetical protein
VVVCGQSTKVKIALFPGHKVPLVREIEKDRIVLGASFNDMGFPGERPPWCGRGGGRGRGRGRGRGEDVPVRPGLHKE